MAAVRATSSSAVVESGAAPSDAGRAHGREAIQHVFGAPAAVSLPFGQFECDRQAFGIHKRVDLGRQRDARATDAAAVGSVLSEGALRPLSTVGAVM